MKQTTDRVVNGLLAGSIPWRLPFLPKNVLSQKFYGSVNPIILSLGANKHRLSSQYWGTPVQWQKFGARVHTVDVNEWGTQIILYKKVVRDITEHRLAMDFVYAGDQTDGMHSPSGHSRFEPEGVFEAIVKKLGVHMEHTGNPKDCTYASPPLDRIRLPFRSMFEFGAGGIDSYYNAFGHELFHATQHRIGWDEEPDVNELRSEIGTGYLCAALGLKIVPLHLRQNHDSYVSVWVKLMRDDPGLLFRVCDNVCDTLTSLLRYANIEMLWQTQPHNPV